MKIVGLAAGNPSRLVTNDEVLDLVVHQSRATFEGDLERTVKLIDKLFHKSGIETRQWLGEDQHPMVLMEAAFERALAQAGIHKDDVDLLVYSSVCRGFTEPAKSTFVAKALGLKCRNFDIVDACMGWVTAMEVVNGKMKAEEIEYAVIVNMEAGSSKNGPVFPNFTLNSASELEYKYPSLTVGDAVTITVLSKDVPSNFHFRFASHPELSDLCTIALPDWKSYCRSSDVERLAAHTETFQVDSYGGVMHEAARPIALDLVKQSRLQPSDLAHVFTHTSSPKMWGQWARTAGFEDKVRGIGHRTGNVVTASVPLAIVEAVDSCVLKPGEPCLAWVGSAGMVVSAVTFTF